MDKFRPFPAQRISKEVSFVQSSNHDPVFSSTIAWGWVKYAKECYFSEVVYQRGKIPCTWTWAQEFFQ